MEKQTIVVKVGTSSLTLSDGTMDAEKIRNITTQLAALQTAGHHVILVSSGAIAAGFSRLGFKKRPTKIADKQAAAAVGQGLLMEEYTKNLMAYQIPCAQILLNRSDFEDRRRYKNIFGSLSVLLGRGAIPIINENDTIAIEGAEGRRQRHALRPGGCDAACIASDSADRYRRALHCQYKE